MTMKGVQKERKNSETKNKRVDWLQIMKSLEMQFFTDMVPGPKSSKNNYCQKLVCL